MEETPPYVEGGSRDPRNPKLRELDDKKGVEKAEEAAAGPAPEKGAQREAGNRTG